MSADLQPDELEVLQAEETDQPAVLVRQEGPVRTQQLPRKSGGTRTRSLTTTPQLLLSADHARASVTLISTASFRFAFSTASTGDNSTMATWPANVPYTLTADTALYACAVTGTAELSIITEYWAAGR